MGIPEGIVRQLTILEEVHEEAHEEVHEEAHEEVHEEAHEEVHEEAHEEVLDEVVIVEMDILTVMHQLEKNVILDLSLGQIGVVETVKLLKIPAHDEEKNIEKKPILQEEQLHSSLMGIS